VLVAAERGDERALAEIRAGRTYITPNQYKEFLDVETSAQRSARRQLLEREGVELFSGPRAGELARTEEFRRVFGAVAPEQGRNDAALAAFSKATGNEAVTLERRLYNFLTQTRRQLEVQIRRLLP
jgi:hypothetical protein